MSHAEAEPDISIRSFLSRFYPGFIVSLCSLLLVSILALSVSLSLDSSPKGRAKNASEKPLPLTSGEVATPLGVD